MVFPSPLTIHIFFILQNPTNPLKPHRRMRILGQCMEEAGDGSIQGWCWEDSKKPELISLCTSTPHNSSRFSQPSPSTMILLPVPLQNGFHPKIVNALLGQVFGQESIGILTPTYSKFYHITQAHKVFSHF